MKIHLNLVHQEGAGGEDVKEGLLGDQEEVEAPVVVQLEQLGCLCHHLHLSLLPCLSIVYGR